MTIDSIFYGRVRTIHFIGIGGIGMSGIAEILLSLGLKVQGSDLNSNDNVKRLIKRGAKIFIGHKAKHVANADVVVTSSAVSLANPEVVEAHKMLIPVVARAEMLAELMRLKYGIAISGSHGKTTTTSLVSTMMQSANLDPTVVIGGKVNQLGSNAMLGKGPFLVAEADESDGSFVKLSPAILVVTNIDPEHLDFWKGGIAQLKSEFTNFINNLPFFGLAVLCNDCPHVRNILPNIKRRFITYGIDQPAEYMATNIKHEGLVTSFTVIKHGKVMQEVKLKLVGKHNVLNALATIAVGDELKVSEKAQKDAFANFDGVQRRFTLIGKVDNITIVDDYAHHPTEIKAVLAAAKLTFPKQRLVVLFQPHRYSRTKHLFDDFKTAFIAADQVIISDIYSAGESNDEAVSAQKLADACNNDGFNNIKYGGTLENSNQVILELCQSNDIILTLGAGNIHQSAPWLLAQLKQGFKG